jgi:hypothetical protein
MGTPAGWTFRAAQQTMVVVPNRVAGEEMAISDKQFGDLKDTVAGIKGSLGTVKFIGGVVAGVLLPAVIGFGWYSVRLGERISHAEGKLNEPLGSMVQGIQSPSSTQQLAANLSLVSSQIRVARVSGKKPDPEKLFPAERGGQTGRFKRPFLAGSVVCGR